ncbi:uncharacterized protein LAJ45_03685 [Morchella importuna]|uniref:uncharacterized protein n=1 Tax=Morchella importuna TaxID=1174673 RepID=UPI001E8CE678|nr:uncharacterized protein LAJ45_03685 [Morchella importuna]KAH8152259.1 hypothetical protein LAJ45_03685 [Morchella importuna]
MDHQPSIQIHSSSSFSINTYLPPRETQRQYHELMSLFHHQAVVSAIRKQQANIDPSLLGKGVGVETGEYSSGSAGYGGGDGGIVDPRLCGPFTLEPVAAAERHFLQDTHTNVGCMDGIAMEGRPVGEMRHYPRHGQEFVNPIEHHKKPNSGGNADIIAAADTPSGAAVATEPGSDVAAITDTAPDTVSIIGGAEEVALVVQIRRSKRKKAVIPVVGSAAARQTNATGSKTETAAAGQSQKVAVSVEGASPSDKSVRRDISPQEQRPKRPYARRTKSQPILPSISATVPVPAAPEPTPTVPFPHKPRGKRDKTPAWYLDSPSSASVDEAVRTAAGTFRCEVCGKEWPCRAALLRHSYKHTKHLKYRRVGCVPAEGGGGLVDEEEE